MPNRGADHGTQSTPKTNQPMIPLCFFSCFFTIWTFFVVFWLAAKWKKQISAYFVILWDLHAWIGIWVTQILKLSLLGSVWFKNISSRRTLFCLPSNFFVSHSFKKGFPKLKICLVWFRGEGRNEAPDPWRKFKISRRKKPRLAMVPGDPCWAWIQGTLCERPRPRPWRK